MSQICVNILLQVSYIYFFKLDISSFLVEIDNEMDAMQATILHLQDKLNTYNRLDSEKPATPTTTTEPNGVQSMDTTHT